VPALATAYEVLKRAEAILNLEKTHGDLIEKNAREIRELADRITKLESRLEIVIAEAKGAAGTAASSAVTQNLVEIARSLGALEERVRVLEEQTRPSRRIEGPGAPGS
jgi:predicted AAA+ superfamily ATPase